MPESDLQQRVLRALGSRLDTRLFRNQCGFGHVGRVVRREPNGIVILAGARPVTFGLTPGSADLIGWRSVTVTPEMVGRKLAVFMGVEVKTARGTQQPNQLVWQQVVRQHGGIAIVARTDNPTELQMLIDKELT